MSKPPRYLRVYNRTAFIPAVLLSLLCFPAAALAQENLGTAVGIPNSSPGIFWPRGFSLETLSPNRLYPNGPEFGLSNTSGGFGVIGTSRMSGVGLSERGVNSLVQEELERPFSSIRQVTDSFNAERTLSAGLFSAVLSSQFRSRIQIGSLYSDLPSSSSYQLDRTLNVDSVLKDLPSTPDNILRTGL